MMQLRYGIIVWVIQILFILQSYLLYCLLIKIRSYCIVKFVNSESMLEVHIQFHYTNLVVLLHLSIVMYGSLKGEKYN